MLIPLRRSEHCGDKYEGAIVIDPQKGYHTEPVACLDFASLYPSIMMAHNLCYSTLIPNHQIKSFNKGKQMDQTPNGDWFIKESIKKGILPLILEDLVGQRKETKRQMAECTDAE